MVETENMTGSQEGQISAEALEMVLESDPLHVSYLSSLLRLLQATIRLAAMERQATRTYFEHRPQPALALSTETREGHAHFSFHFVDPLQGTHLPELTQSTFEVFMSEFAQLLKESPQRSLWGISSRSPKRALPSELLRRLDQLRIQLRRVPRAILSYGEQRITIERNGIEISW